MKIRYNPFAKAFQDARDRPHDSHLSMPYPLGGHSSMSGLSYSASSLVPHTHAHTSTYNYSYNPQCMNLPTSTGGLYPPCGPADADAYYAGSAGAIPSTVSAFYRSSTMSTPQQNSPSTPPHTPAAPSHTTSSTSESSSQVPMTTSSLYTHSPTCTYAYSYSPQSGTLLTTPAGWYSSCAVTDNECYYTPTGGYIPSTMSALYGSSSMTVGQGDVPSVTPPPPHPSSFPLQMNCSSVEPQDGKILTTNYSIIDKTIASSSP